MISPVRNFAIFQTVQGYSNTATAISLVAGSSTALPTVGIDGSYNLVWFNNSDYRAPYVDPFREIIKVVGNTGDTLAILRGQENTLAQNHNIPGKQYSVILSLTQQCIDEIRSSITGLESATSSLVSSKVPYTDANDNVNLGSYSFTANTVSAITFYGDGSKLEGITGSSGVPYVGASANVDLGIYSLSATTFYGDGSKLTGITAGMGNGGGVPYSGATADLNLASYSLSAYVVSSNDAILSSVSITSQLSVLATATGNLNSHLSATDSGTGSNASRISGLESATSNLNSSIGNLQTVQGHYAVLSGSNTFSNINSISGSGITATTISAVTLLAGNFQTSTANLNSAISTLQNVQGNYAVLSSSNTFTNANSISGSGITATTVSAKTLLAGNFQTSTANLNSAIGTLQTVQGNYAVLTGSNTFTNVNSISGSGITGTTVSATVILAGNFQAITASFNTRISGVETATGTLSNSIDSLWNSKIPYSGATADLNFGLNALSGGGISGQNAKFMQIETNNSVSAYGGLSGGNARFQQVVTNTSISAGSSISGGSSRFNSVRVDGSISGLTISGGSVRLANLVFGDGSIQTVASTGGTGEANIGANLIITGSGTAGVFAQKVGITLQFKDLIAGSNIGITESASAITISGSSQGGGGGVPYTGATADVNLATHSLTAQTLSSWTTDGLASGTASLVSGLSGFQNTTTASLNGLASGTANIVAGLSGFENTTTASLAGLASGTANLVAGLSGFENTTTASLASLVSGLSGFENTTTASLAGLASGTGTLFTSIGTTNNAKVPYSGASADVSLGSQSLSGAGISGQNARFMQVETNNSVSAFGGLSGGNAKFQQLVTNSSISAGSGLSGGNTNLLRLITQNEIVSSASISAVGGISGGNANFLRLLTQNEIVSSSSISAVGGVSGGNVRFLRVEAHNSISAFGGLSGGQVRTQDLVSNNSISGIIVSGGAANFNSLSAQTISAFSSRFTQVWFADGTGPMITAPTTFTAGTVSGRNLVVSASNTANIYTSAVGNELQFKVIAAGSNVTIDQNASGIIINSSGGGGGGGVPYTGATANVDLGTWTLSAQSISAGAFSATASISAGTGISGGNAAFQQVITNNSISAGSTLSAGASNVNSISAVTVSALAGRIGTLWFNDSTSMQSAAGGIGSATNVMTSGTNTANVYLQTIGSQLQFNAIIGGANVGITQSSSSVTISAAAGGGGGGVPYSGATADINLGTFGLSGSSFTADNSLLQEVLSGPPSPPPLGYLSTFAENFADRPVFGTRTPRGLTTYYQTAMWSDNVIYLYPNAPGIATTMTGIGLVWTASGRTDASSLTLSSTNLLSTVRRTRFNAQGVGASSVGPLSYAGLSGSWNSSSGIVWRGSVQNGVSAGGFFMAIEFANNSSSSDANGVGCYQKCFIGLTRPIGAGGLSGITFTSSAEATALSSAHNLFGIGYEIGSTTSEGWSFYTSGSGSSYRSAGFLSRDPMTALYCLYIYAPPSAKFMSLQLDNLSDNTTVTSFSYAVEDSLPASGAFLLPIAIVAGSSGGANRSASLTSNTRNVLDVAKFYISSDF